MKISVFGLGYVGMVNIACLSKVGHQVYGCDVKQHKVDLINQGKSTVFEPGVSEMMEEAHEKELVKASSDAELCVANSDIALLCVGTPSDVEGNVNLSYILNVTRDIIKALKKLDKPFTIVYRSTIPPGTIDNQILPVISPYFESLSHKPKIVFLPEFLREGNAVKDFFECARIVVGVDENENAKDQLTELFSFNQNIPIHFTNYRTAEFVKYVDNAYHATKVSFANEIYSIGSSMDVDIVTANKLFLSDDILNISTKYLIPGMPFGGSCLPKDTRALIHMGIKNEVDTPFIRGIFESNNAHKQRIVEKVLKFEKDKIFLYGITFKQDTDDIRESPFIFLLESLIAKGKQVRVFDDRLNLTSLRIEFPHLVQYIHDDLNELVKWSDLIILNNKNYENVLAALDSSKSVLNCLNNNDISTNNIIIENLY
ncbi:MAG: nucleotide sugar dehydrogenase [Melioribacteraceae bacterium]|nr:nucleotide sugar dehydrogenase [Melioribacteraceae bacterium]MCF8263389.1 nucleotide sugar dehydrogenase [Melioribacteraceae bacterium]MCF8430875.1 nucleotide sugar dehydrogenase [Melioribacteraceae bacterium]